MPFTENERQAIDAMHKRGFTDMTPEDVSLYGRWCAESAALAREEELKNSAIMEETKARADMFKAQAELARAQFEKLIGVDDGQQESE